MKRFISYLLAVTMMISLCSAFSITNADDLDTPAGEAVTRVSPVPGGCGSPGPCVCLTSCVVLTSHVVLPSCLCVLGLHGAFCVSIFPSFKDTTNWIRTCPNP